MEVTNPRRLLAVSLETEAELLSKFIKDLTGSHPTPSSAAEHGGGGGLAGTTHELALDTPYYRVAVPVWLDTPAAPADWAATFLSAEAREVLSALGGVAVVFPLGGAEAPGRAIVEAVGRVVKEGLGGWEWDGVGLAVGVGEMPPGFEGVDGDEGWWEECCAQAGLEFVHVKAGGGVGDAGRNEFGEKTGIPRVLEALQANDWTMVGMDDDDVLGLDDDRSDFGDFEMSGKDGKSEKDPDPKAMGFGFDKADFEGLKRAIWSSGVETEDDGKEKEVGAGGDKKTVEGEEEDIGQEDVEKVEAMMRKLLAVRELGSGLPEEQRKRLAARAVGEVMREL